jgi:signal transduction histidine kinase
MIDHFTTESIIHFLTALAAFVIIALLWKFRKSPEVKFLIYVQLFVSVWTIAYALEFASTELQSKIFWAKLSYLGIGFLPLSFFLFTTAFSQKKDSIKRNNIILLLIIPFITLGMVATNAMHKLVWTNVILDSYRNIAFYEHGLWFWIFFGYTEILLVGGLFNLYSSIFKFTAYHRSQIATLIIATIFPIIGNIIYITNFNPYPGFDWTPVSFVISGLIITLGVVRYRMFDIVPFAKAKLFDVINDGVIVINAEGFIEDCNWAANQIFNWQHNFIPHNQVNNAFKNYPVIIEGIENKNASIQLEVNRDGWINYFLIRISPIYHNNKLSGNILLFHDITTIRKAEEELKKTNLQLMAEIEKREKLIEDLDAFAHTVAHDLRNSLSSIFSASEIMEEIIRQNDKNLLFELSNLINHSANKSIQITHDLLMLATTDKTKVESKPINMALIFTEAQKQLSELIKTSDAEIKVPEKWPEALGYAPWIEEVWTNYLSNGIKYGGLPPKIEVGATVLAQGDIKFWIKDNGDGLSSDELKKLFKKFVRLNPKKADGYGLGLTIVKKIIEKLGGSVDAESIKGEGSIFSFTLPPAHNKIESTFIKLHESTGYAFN